jgi:methionyl-tRNA formyltransferase
MKFGFVTCVQLGLSCLEAIYEIEGAIDLVITLNDDQAVNKSGRVYLDDFCSKHSVPLHKSSHINNSDVIKAIVANELDWLFVIGWSQIASNDVLKAPRKGAIGIHPTLLPKGRGRAAIPWAILKRLEKTGVTLFRLDAGVDTGDIINQIEIPLHQKITATELYGLVNRAQVELIQSTYPLLLDAEVELASQDDALATEWPGRKPEDGQINLKGSVHEAECLVRAVTRPYPGAYLVRNDKKIIVWSAEVSARCPQQESNENCIQFNDGVLVLIETEVVE